MWESSMVQDGGGFSDDGSCGDASDGDLECPHSPTAPRREKSSTDNDADADATAATSAAAVGKGCSATTKAASALIIAASDKAGMAGIDRDRINAILLRESGNSTFMRRQKKMDENSDRKVDEMRERLRRKDEDADDSSGNWRRELQKSTIDPLLNEFRRRRKPISTCVVVDMDGFFISCHTMLQPHLADIPACVGGTSMISTSNYNARRYGVRAAMPGYLGQTLVRELSGGREELTFVRSDFDLYKRKSAEVRKILEEYDPSLKMYSLDEAYCDIGPYLEVQLLNQGVARLSHEEIRKRLLDNTKPSADNQQSVNQLMLKPVHETIPIPSIHDAAQRLLHTIRERVKDVTGLTCSAGLASNFLLAKIASDMNKPNGQFFVGPSEEQISKFVNPLSIRKVSGIGRVMEKMLRGVCGVETVRDLYDKRADVYFLFKPATAQFLMRASIGYKEGNHHEPSEEEKGESEEALGRKGISHERTFSPTSSWSDMCTRLEGIALSLSDDLRERNLMPRTVTLKVKLSNFDILTRATTLHVAMFQKSNDQSTQDLVDIVINLLKEAKREHEKGNDSSKSGKTARTSTKAASSFSVRLLGVRCSGFQVEKDNQSSLDRYRVNNYTNTSELQSTQQCNISPVKNPYASPKGKRSVSNEMENGSKRSRYTASPSVPNPGTYKPHTGNLGDESCPSGGSNQIVSCPICQKQFVCREKFNADINAHLDACLNATTVKRLAKEETTCADERSLKKRKGRLSDFFR